MHNPRFPRSWLTRSRTGMRLQYSYSSQAANTDLPSSVYLRCRCVLTGCFAIALLDVPPGTPASLQDAVLSAPRCRLGLHMNPNRYNIKKVEARNGRATKKVRGAMP